METVQPHSMQVLTSKSVTKLWELENWDKFHGVLTKKDSCEIHIGNNVLRLFLCPAYKEMITKDYAVTMNFYALWVELIEGPNEYPFHLEWSLKILNRGCCDGNPQDFSGSVSNIVLRNQKQMLSERFINMGSSSIRLINASDYVMNPCEEKHYFSKVKELIIEFSLSSLELTKKTIKTQQGQANLLDQRKLAMLNEHAHLFDVKLKMKDDIIVGSHKIILSANSPVFRAMFTSGMTESTENAVLIPDLSSDTMKIILQYIYTDEVNESWKNNVIEVVHGASKYGLVNLLEYLNINLITVCTAENAVELFKLAKLQNLGKAMEQLTEYTRRHTADVLLGMRLD